jgi:hypothetical protein
MRAHTTLSHAAALTVAVFATGCSSYNPYAITVYGEAFIEEGIPADAFADGWRVDFTRFLILLSDVGVGASSTTFVTSAPVVIDLSVPTDGAGTVIDTLTVQSGTYTKLQYSVAPYTSSNVPTGSTADIAALEATSASLLVDGRATRGDEVIRFSWTFAHDVFHTCAIEQDVSGDALGKSEITIHADHLFYDDLDDDEPDLRFDLVASADADGDGQVTQAELAAVDITGLDRYGTGSRPIRNLGAFIDAQTKTLGHFDGEGHCETSTSAE